MKRIKNNTEINQTWVGQLILPNTYYTIQATEEISWVNNSALITAIGNLEAVVNDGNADITDVALAINYLKNIRVHDTDGRTLVRAVAAKDGWKAQFQAIRITTSTVDGVHNKDKSGNNLGFCTYTMYDSQNQVTAIIADCVKTVVTWEVSHDMEIVGGRLFQKTAPNTDMWLYVTAAAHIPAQYGGSIAFLEGGMNLMDVADGGEVDFDGRASKFIAYDSVNHSGRFEILLKHNAGVQHSFSLVFELFRP